VSGSTSCGTSRFSVHSKSAIVFWHSRSFVDDLNGCTWMPCSVVAVAKPNAYP
jgi:hypothetical protein